MVKRPQSTVNSDPEAIRIANWLVDKKPSLPYIDDSFNEMPWHTSLIDQGFTKLWQKKDLLLPNLKDSKSISILSDYSGEIHSSCCNVYSFVVCDFSAHESFSNKTSEIRKNFGLHEPYKEMSYKSLSYAPVKRALGDWLTSADSCVPGLLFNLVVDKEIGTFSGSHLELKKLKALMGAHSYTTWSLQPLEKVLRILHVVAYLFGLLSSDNAKLFWMSDNDDIASNEEKKNDLLKMLRNAIAMYSKGKRSERVGFATPFSEDINSKLKMADLLSLADLSAGAICNLLNSKNSPETAFKKDGQVIIDWLGQQSVFLKKYTFYLRKNNSGLIETGFFTFNNSQNTVSTANDFIPIFI